MSCTHEIQREEWITEDYRGRPIPGEWKYWFESTTEDIDTHRYRCTQCNEVMYYSGRARDYFENGIKSNVPGLDI